jgi:prepilin-type N-terminal cleavage/methylation domain-containing protein
MGKNLKGFTLIELMLVSAIISVMVSIAIPKFGNLIIKAKEAAVRGKLGSLRSAMAIYYADNQVGPCVFGNGGQMVNDLVPKYIESFPMPNLPNLGRGHDYWNPDKITEWPAHMVAIEGLPPAIPEAAERPAWDKVYYRYFATDNGSIPDSYPNYLPRFYINCGHRDSSGRVWSTW